MNNKLVEILDEFDKLTLGYCDDEELDEVSYLAGQAHFKKYYKKFLKKKIVEYARSLLDKNTIITGNEYVKLGYRYFYKKINTRIDQDLLSLKEKNI